MLRPAILLTLCASALVLSAVDSAQAGRRRPPPPDIDVPASLDFGIVTPGTSVIVQLQIDNLGPGSNLLVTDIVSDNSAVFTPLQTSVVVPGGTSALIDVQFTPPGADLYTGTLTVLSFDPDEPAVPVAVVGIGDGPNIQADPLVDFGNIGAFATAIVQLRIDNVGTQTLTVSNIESDNPDCVPLQSAASIAPGGFELIDVQLTTQAFGKYEGTLTITSDDPDQPTLALGLVGGPIALFLEPSSAGAGDGGALPGLGAFYLFGDGSVVQASLSSGNLPAYSSSDTGVVSVLASGNLIVNGPGSATITGTVVGLSDVSNVTVGAPSSILRVVLSPANVLTLLVGETRQFSAWAIDAQSLGNLDDVEVVSDTPSVLAVDSVVMQGDSVRAEIRGVSPGQAQLTVRSLDDPGVFLTTELHVVGVESIEIMPASAALPVSGVENLSARLIASDGTLSFSFVDDTLWSSSDAAVAPVFPNGKLVGLTAGSALVTAQAASNPSVQDSIPVVVTAGSDFPAVGLRDLQGVDIVASGIALGEAHYGATNQAGIVSVPRLEKVFVVDSLGVNPVEVVYVESSTDRLVPSASEGPIAAGRIGALHVLLTMPSSALGGSDPGPTTGTVTVFTNDPARHQIVVPVSWSWKSQRGEVADAATQMFIDFGDVPQGASRDRSFVFQLFEQGPGNGVVTSVNTNGSAFLLRAPNPNPFMLDACPCVQSNEEVPLTFTVRATPGAAAGRYEGVVSFASDDLDEPLIEALVVVYGAAAPADPLPGDLAYAAGGSTWLRTPDGSELILIPFPSGNDGLEYDAASGVAYMYSGSALSADPNANPNNFSPYLFKVVPGAKPQLITDALGENPVGLAVDFPQNLAYAIDLKDQSEDLLKVTDAGNVSVLVSAGFTGSSRLGIDSAGNLYASRVLTTNIGMNKYAPSGALLARFASSGNIRDFEVANVLGMDTLYTDLGTKLDTSGTQIGIFELVPVFEWYTVDALGNVLFADGIGLSSEPQDLTLEDPVGNLSPAGQLPLKSSQGDF